ncbi:unnamed protein product [Darwinula stevensoni]|uniref:RING-type domain-containing protein n=1 Tax=Darwinula stevensoni TaxID=69355 RepID=A0A7R8XAW8_9CRUS|nr:unnamed protein product [Darwinula stevensoni]CAG0892318.1 unnamed protein product [Darwinula stevensoni]
MLIVRCVREGPGRFRLPFRSLVKIPTITYRKGDPYDTCAICLEDYEEGERLRVLPCSHGLTLTPLPDINKAGDKKKQIIERGH